MKKTIPKRILPIIVLAEFAGTSLWFAGNTVIPDLVQEMQLTEMAVSYITSAVQLGFISGTLLFAFLSVADRMSPSKVISLVCWSLVPVLMRLPSIMAPFAAYAQPVCYGILFGRNLSGGNENCF